MNDRYFEVKSSRTEIKFYNNEVRAFGLSCYIKSFWQRHLKMILMMMPLVHVLIGFLTFFFYFSRSSSNEINRNRAAPGHAPQNIRKVKRAPVKPPPLVCDPNDKPDLSLIPEQKTLCYQTYDDISNRRIIGRWEDNAVFSTPGIFSYTNNVRLSFQDIHVDSMIMEMQLLVNDIMF